MPLLHRGLLYALGGVFVLNFSANLFAQGGPQTAANDQRNAPVTAAVQANPPASAVAVGEIASAELPDSPGAVRSQEQNAAQPQSTPSEPSIEEIPTEQNATPPQRQPEQKPQRPVGTAAAEAPMVTGVTAAQPAGVAIAPAKQRRVRTLVIKIGAIAGAAVALGTTMALTMGTPSKPPGAH